MYWGDDRHNSYLTLDGFAVDLKGHGVLVHAGLLVGVGDNHGCGNDGVQVGFVLCTDRTAVRTGRTLWSPPTSVHCCYQSRQAVGERAQNRFAGKLFQQVDT